MAEPALQMTIDEDLPRTLKRERERQSRETLSAQPRPEPQPVASYGTPGSAADIGPPATVTAFDVPFVSLMMFLIKCVLAGIPALILLLAILWGFGEILQKVFPALLKMKILIHFPG